MIQGENVLTSPICLQNYYPNIHHRKKAKGKKWSRFTEKFKFCDYLLRKCIQIQGWQALNQNLQSLMKHLKCKSVLFTYSHWMQLRWLHLMNSVIKWLINRYDYSFSSVEYLRFILQVLCSLPLFLLHEFVSHRLLSSCTWVAEEWL